jgi:hypothetical protein
MQVTTTRRRTKTEAQLFTIRGISRETLSLILSFAVDGLDLPKNRNLQDVRPIVEAIDSYVNDEDPCTRMTPLTL